MGAPTICLILVSVKQKETKDEMNNQSPWSFTTQRVVLAALFAALVVVLKLTGIGVIPVPNLSGGATIYHVPVILGGIIGGPIVGMVAGLVMGILLLIDFAAFGPIVMLPGRILIGLMAWLVYRALRKGGAGAWLAGLVAGAVGALTNTVVTVLLATTLKSDLFPAVAVPTVLPQAGAELVIGAIICAIVAQAVESALKARNA